MAVYLNNHTLSDEECLKTRKRLYIVPIENNFTNGGGFHSKFKKSTKTPVMCYKTKREDDGKTITYMLPFHYIKENYGRDNDEVKHKKVRFKFLLSLYDDQVDFTNEAIEHLQDHGAVTLVPRPGYGKTTISIALSSTIKYRTLVLLHNSTMVPQWVSAYENRTNAKVWAIKTGNKNNPPEKFDVIVCLYTRTSKIPEDIRSTIGTLIIDEVHEFCNQTGIESILDFQPKYTIACSATFERADGLHKVAETVLGTKRIGEDMKLPDFYVRKVNTNFVAERKMQGKAPIWSVLYQSILYNKERNKSLINVAKQILIDGRKPLFFTIETKHTEMLNDLFLKNGIPSCDYLCGDKKKYKNSLILVGNIQKCGTGFDEEMFCDNFDGIRIDTVVFCAPLKDIARLYQSAGRAFRSKKPLIYHLIDNDPTLKRQWTHCNKWYTEHSQGVSAMDLEYFDEQMAPGGKGRQKWKKFIHQYEKKMKEKKEEEEEIIYLDL